MPVPFAPLVGFVLGVVLAWIARDELTRGEGPLVASRPVAVATALAVFVYAPIVGYFLAFHGDWSYLYLYPHARIPSAIDLALVLVAAGEVPLGVILAAPAARARRLGAVVWLAAVPGVAAAGLFAWCSRRLSVSATYTQFHRGFGAAPLRASPLGQGVFFMVIVGALAVAWAVRSVARPIRPPAAQRGSSEKSRGSERSP